MNAQRNTSDLFRGWTRPLAVPVHRPSRVAGMTLRPKVPEHAGRQIGIFEPNACSQSQNRTDEPDSLGRKYAQGIPSWQGCELAQ